MITVIPLADPRVACTTAPVAVPPSLSTPAVPDLIKLHAQAENALSMALYYLRYPDGGATTLQAATARAIRAATLLKRASECTNTAVEG